MKDFCIKNLSFITYDSKIHDEASVKKLLAYCVYSPTDEKLHNVLKGYFQKNNRILLCISNHQIVGFVGYDPSGKILHIAVLPEFRNKGIADHLISEVMKKCPYLIAETDNESVGFYRSCGFEIKSLGELYPGTERFQCIKKIK